MRIFSQNAWWHFATVYLANELQFSETSWIVDRSSDEVALAIEPCNKPEGDSDMREMLVLNQTKKAMVLALTALSMLATAQVAAAAPSGGVVGSIREADSRDHRGDGGGWRDGRDGRGDRGDRGDRGGRDGRGDRGGRDGRGRGGYDWVTLTRYYSIPLGDHWITTEEPSDRSYDFEQTLGYLLTSPAPGFQPLYECLVNGRDHMLSVRRDCERQYNMGLLGYIRTNPERNTRPLYRCITNDAREHFASFDRYCEGHRTEGVLGNIDQ